MTRNEFIAETAAKHDVVLDADRNYRNGCVEAVMAAINLASALEAAKCAPWANYDVIVSHGRQEAIDSAVTKERERCAQIAMGESQGMTGSELAAAIRSGAAP